MNRFLKIFGGLMIAACLSACGDDGSATDGGGSPPPVASETVTVAQGTLHGVTTAGAQQFLAVPYAAPPTGNLRWKAPQPAASWTGVREASTLPPACPIAGNTPYSEDCLYLDVYRPAVASSVSLPVMFFIHGAGFSGQAARVFDGSKLAKAGPAIIVVPNHRRNVFGYLALAALKGESAVDEGNYGLLDMIAALEWVRGNAAAFGGDPRNVTVFGTSGGGIAGCFLLGTPRAAGLFQRMMIQSGPCDDPSFQQASPTAAEATGASFATRAGCTDPTSIAACMRSKTAAELLAVAAQGAGIGPRIGTGLIPLAPDAAFAIGSFTRVPTVVGGVHDERRTIAYPIFRQSTAAASFQQYVQTNFGANANRVLAEYPLTSFTDPAYAEGAVISDSGINIGLGACRFLRRAELLARYTPTWYYEMNDPNGPAALSATPPPAGILTGSTHADNDVWLLDNRPGWLGGALPTYTTSQTDMIGSMLAFWTTFAKDTSPRAGSTTWSSYVGGINAQVLEIAPSGNAMITRSAYRSDHHCDFWDALAAGG